MRQILTLEFIIPDEDENTDTIETIEEMLADSPFLWSWGQSWYENEDDDESGE